MRDVCTYVVPNCEISYSNAPCVEYLATFGHQKSCIDGKHVDQYSIPGACGIVNDNTIFIARHSYHWMIILGPPYCLRVVESHSTVLPPNGADGGILLSEAHFVLF